MDKTSLILGFFDGVHKGHREVIKTAIGHGKTFLITFKNSPAEHFGKKVEYIYPREKSYELIKSLGVDEIIEQDFSEIAKVSAEDYLENYLVKKYTPITISTGFNHTFGAHRTGNSEFLEKNQEKYNYKYFCSPACCIDNEVVSSSKIRELLMEGNIEKANKFLGSNFSITSTVTEGEKLGRKIGFPTANLVYPEKIVRLPYGVYGVKVFGKPAVLNWGVKPTVGGKYERIEVHIPDFSGNLYNLLLEVVFVKKIREEQKFASLDELKHQIKKDVEECLKL